MPPETNGHLPSRTISLAQNVHRSRSARGFFWLLANPRLLGHLRSIGRVEERGLVLGSDGKDPYVGAMRAEIRGGRDDYFLDRLLVSGIVEARGCERFGMIAQALTDPSLRNFYREIAASEARHDTLFVGLAETYFSRVSVAARLDALIDTEAKIIEGLAIRPALH